jgi:tetratricopeptide (TPR) repeat protein
MAHPTDILHQAETLYDHGQYASAYAVCAPLGKMGSWPGLQGRILAGRLTYQLGRASWGTALHQLAWREYPAEPRAIYYGSLAIRSRRGPLRTWLEVRNLNLPGSASAEEQADWMAFKGSLLSSLRDFQRAQKWIERSLDQFPDSPWNHLVQADLHRMRDQREAAIDSCRKSLELRPNYRPAVQTYAELLIEANRQEEAYSLLASTTRNTESPLLTAQLAFLCLELKRFDETLELLTQYKQLAVLAVAKHVDAWLNMMRTRTLYLAGRFEEAIPFARCAELDYCERFADRLEQTLRDNIDPRTCRVTLPVSFVRQNRSTCAPATLAALSDYWDKPIQHEEIAARICYDGTLSHDERRWASENGFLAKDFCVTGQAAHDLINAGIPFSLTTIGIASGHLQAVVGYDSIGEVLIIRDPASHSLLEATTHKLLEYYASSGPRGMLMVPIEQSTKLQTLSLPESELYDLQYAIDIALSRHERDRAIELLAKMKEVAPDHRLTLQSEFSLSRYDGHHHDCLAIARKLLEKYPSDLRLVLCQFDYIHEIGSRNERIEFLQKAVNKFGPNPRLMCNLAEEYLMDAREYRKAAKELRWLARWLPHDASAVVLYARLAWEQQRHEDAIELCRIAACLEEKDESYSRTFFSTASRHHGADMAMEWLRERHQLWGKQNSDPTLSYIWALEETQQAPLALATFREALAWRPEDGSLLCNAALCFERYGLHDEAQACLEQAEGRTTETKLLRTRAMLAKSRGHLVQAREHYERLIQLAPTDWNALDTLLDLDLQLDDETLAEKRLRLFIEQWPQCTPLQERLVSWLRKYRPEALSTELEKALENDPNNTWLLREAAIAALQRNDSRTALEQVSLCLKLEPNYYRNWNLLAHIYSEIGDRPEVRKSVMRALQLCIDNQWGIHLLISTCRSDEEYEHDFRFLLDQLRIQATQGEGILAYHKFGTARRDSKLLLEDLREAHRERPDLWQAWSALTQQYSFMGMHDDALICARNFTERFPFSVEAWLEYAHACKMCANPDLQLEALQKAFQINPTSAEIVRQISDIYFERNEAVKAIDILQKAISSNPRDGVLYGYLADILWSENQQSEALQAIRKAVTLYPDYDWAWNCLGYWCQQIDRQEDAFETARSLLLSERTIARGYLRLTEFHLRWQQPEEAVRTAQAGIKADPLHVGLRTLYVHALDCMGRSEEAIAACQPHDFQADIPAQLIFLEGDLLYRLDRKTEALEKRKLGLNIAPFSHEEWHKFLELSRYYSPIEDHVVACQKFVSLAPADALAHSYLASALQKWKPEERQLECIAGYETALKFDATLATAAYELFYLYLKVSRWQDARKLAHSFPDTIDPEHHDTLRLLSDCLQDEVTTLASIDKYSQNDLSISYHSLRRGLDICEPLHWITAMENAWETEPHRLWLGKVWGESVWRQETPQRILQKLSRLPIGEAWHAAWKTLLRNQRASQLPIALVSKVTKKFKTAISQRSSTWSAVATYFLEFGDASQAYRWCRNWKTIKIDTPEDLVACITAHWWTRRYTVAHSLVKQGQAMQAESPERVIELWDIVEQIRRGSSAGVVEKLKVLQRKYMDKWYCELTSMMLQLAKTIEKIERAATMNEKRAILQSLKLSDLKSYALISEDWKQWYLTIVCQSLSYRFGIWWDFLKFTLDRIFKKSRRE